MTFTVLSSPETVRDTVQCSYCIVSLRYRLLRIRLKLQNPSLPYVRDRQKVHCIITLFNVGNVLLCLTYQLQFTVFMYVT